MLVHNVLIDMRVCEMYLHHMRTITGKEKRFDTHINVRVSSELVKRAHRFKWNMSDAARFYWEQCVAHFEEQERKQKEKK